MGKKQKQKKQTTSEHWLEVVPGARNSIHTAKNNSQNNRFGSFNHIKI